MPSFRRFPDGGSRGDAEPASSGPCRGLARQAISREAGRSAGRRPDRWAPSWNGATIACCIWSRSAGHWSRRLPRWPRPGPNPRRLPHSRRPSTGWPLRGRWPPKSRPTSRSTIVRPRPPIIRFFPILLGVLADLMRHSRRQTISKTGMERALSGHRDVLQAVRSRQPEKARKAMLAHLALAEQDLHRSQG